MNNNNLILNNNLNNNKDFSVNWLICYTRLKSHPHHQSFQENHNNQHQHNNK